MKTRVQQHGDSLAVCLPSSMAVQAQIQSNTFVDVSLVNGKLVVSSFPEPELTLEQLLAGVTEENLHGEVDVGPPVGREAW